jgi:hypothetical protein
MKRIIATESFHLEMKLRSIILHIQKLEDKHQICMYINQIPRTGTRKQMTYKD